MNMKWIFSLLMSFFASVALALSSSSAAIRLEVNQINSALLKDQIKSPIDIPANTIWPHLISHFSLSESSNNPRVKQEVAWWLAHKGFLNAVLQHSAPYLAYIYQQTQERHMPAEFALLPAIESGYNPFAYSTAGATGLWQMMPATATDFHLTMNWWYDARRDTIVSTKTALDYLSTLQVQLHSWLLAAAAYDDGVGSIQKAEMQQKQTNFWQLNLPTETQTYVPRLLALAEIISQAAKYHIHLPKIPFQPQFVKVTLTSQIDLAQVSHLAETDITTLEKLNPGMLRFATDPQNKSYLLLPEKKAKIFFHNIQEVDGEMHLSWRYHQVQPKETLAKLSKIFHTNETLLRWVNHLSPTEAVVENQGILVPLALHEKFHLPILSNPGIDYRFKLDQQQIETAVNKLYHSAV